MLLAQAMNMNCFLLLLLYHIEVAHSIDLTTVCVNKNMQSGLLIAHGSLLKAVCRPSPATPPTIWVVLSDWPEPKPHGSYVCTVGCSQIERRSSSLSTAHAVPVVILFLCTKCTLISKNVLNLANDTWNAPENQTHGIMVIAYHGKFYETKRMKSPATGVWIDTSPFGTPWSFMRDAPVWKERSSKLVPNFTNFFHGVVRERHRHTSILMMSELHLNFL